MLATVTQDLEVEALRDLNRAYVRAVRNADLGWFEEHLADDFVHGAPDCTLLDRPQFLARIGTGGGVSGLEEHNVDIRRFGDVALVQANTRYEKGDGRTGAGCYLDVWARRAGRWLCVAAHVNRS